MARKQKKEITPQKLREILRLGLKHQLGYREISRSCAVSRVLSASVREIPAEDVLTWAET